MRHARGVKPDAAYQALASEGAARHISLDHPTAAATVLVDERLLVWEECRVRRGRRGDNEHRRARLARHLSSYSHVYMEAKRRALDEIAARQRKADEKRKEETGRREQAAEVCQSAVVQ